MATVGVRELRQRASELLRRVEAGETIEVTDRGRPVAVLAPLPEAGPLEQLRADPSHRPDPHGCRVTAACPTSLAGCDSHRDDAPAWWQSSPGGDVRQPNGGGSFGDGDDHRRAQLISRRVPPTPLGQR